MTEQGSSARGFSRRDLIAARIPQSRNAPDTGHIASLMVQVRPEFMPDLTPALNAIPCVEVHGGNPQGRMIVTVEAADDGRLMDAIARIEGTENVIMASLVFHQIEA